MGSRQIVQGLLILAGLSILVLLMIPAVHVPCIVVHGPATALRAQRAAWLLTLLIRAAALSDVGMLTVLSLRTVTTGIRIPICATQDSALNCSLRC
jgi:hypothetical protein